MQARQLFQLGYYPSAFWNERINICGGYFFGVSCEGPREHWLHGRHSIQRWFGVGTYLLLIPNSYSQRLQDDQEATTLLSSLSVALTSSGCHWPAFLPLHNVHRVVRSGVPILVPSQVTKSCKGITPLRSSRAIEMVGAGGNRHTLMNE
eukprot:scaffold8947_cov19-Prasinocladus_malaysianus.AAC.1